MPGSAAALLLCRAGGRLLAVALTDVLEVMRPVPVDSLPDLPVFVLGVATIRGRPAPVIDASALVGPPGAVPSRFISTSVGGRIVALAVESIVGIRTIAGDVLGELPPLLGTIEREVFSAIAALDGDLLLVLDSARLIPDAIWQTVDQVTTS